MSWRNVTETMSFSNKQVQSKSFTKEPGLIWQKNCESKKLSFYPRKIIWPSWKVNALLFLPFVLDLSVFNLQSKCQILQKLSLNFPNPNSIVIQSSKSIKSDLAGTRDSGEKQNCVTFVIRQTTQLTVFHQIWKLMKTGQHKNMKHSIAIKIAS